jgi:hypothetical protein
MRAIFVSQVIPNSLLKIDRLGSRTAQAAGLIPAMLISAGRLASFRCVFQRVANFRPHGGLGSRTSTATEQTVAEKIITGSTSESRRMGGSCQRIEVFCGYLTRMGHVGWVGDW